MHKIRKIPKIVLQIIIVKLIKDLKLHNNKIENHPY